MSHAIREAILAQLPEADIRTDQCSTIRVYWRDVCGGISPLENGEFRVSAGDAQAQYDNLVFESSFSTTSPTQAAAVDNLVNACRSIVTQREQDAQQ